MSDSTVNEALEALKEGRFVIVYDADGREEECDLFLPAEVCRPEHIRTMRRDGGGLIFLMVRPDVRDQLSMPFMQDLFVEIGDAYPIFKHLIPDDIPYDSRSSFSVTINHRNTFTGITDNDRALTVKEFGLLAQRIKDISPHESLDLFGEAFRTPGHIAVCIASDQILESRFGHTELSCALSTMAGLSGVTVGCEIMGDDGASMGKASVKEYALENNIPFLEGKQIIDAWTKWNGAWKETWAVKEKEREEQVKGKRVVATGVFDLLHPGHLDFLEQAKAMGDELVVVVARDATAVKLKHHPVNKERLRRELIEALSMVDRAVLGYPNDHFRIIKEIQPDVIVLGYDQQPSVEELEADLGSRGIGAKVVRLEKRTGDIDGTRKIITKILEERGSGC